MTLSVKISIFSKMLSTWHCCRHIPPLVFPFWHKHSMWDADSSICIIPCGSTCRFDTMAEALSLFAQVLRQLQWNPQQWLVAGWATPWKYESHWGSSYPNYGGTYTIFDTFGEVPVMCSRNSCNRSQQRKSSFKSITRPFAHTRKLLLPTAMFDYQRVFSWSLGKGLILHHSQLQILAIRYRCQILFFLKGLFTWCITDTLSEVKSPRLLDNYISMNMFFFNIPILNRTMIHNPCCLLSSVYSLGWFKGKSTEKHGFSGETPRF